MPERSRLRQGWRCGKPSGAKSTRVRGIWGIHAEDEWKIAALSWLNPTSHGIIHP